MKNILLVIGLVAALWSYADSDDHKEKKRKHINPVTNELYQKNCGTCHFAYQPGLLPKRSWTNIIDIKGGHIGGELSIDKTTKDKIRAYLVQESADFSSSERSRKIIASIPGSSTPIRITDVPYIQKKHRELGKDIFKRTSIGSFANCMACHQKADKGIYEDDDVVIPSK